MTSFPSDIERLLKDLQINNESSNSPLSSSCFLTPTVFGRPRPLRIGSDWLLARDLLLFSMSLVKDESILSLRIRSVLRRFNSSLSAVSNKEKKTLIVINYHETISTGVWRTSLLRRREAFHGKQITKNGSIYWDKH